MPATSWGRYSGSMGRPEIVVNAAPRCPGSDAAGLSSSTFFIRGPRPIISTRFAHEYSRSERPRQDLDRALPGVKARIARRGLAHPLGSPAIRGQGIEMSGDGLRGTRPHEPVLAVAHQLGRPAAVGGGDHRPARAEGVPRA